MKAFPTRTLLALAFLCMSTAAALAASEENSRPNILIIYTDDQGYGDASIYNPESKIQTPHLDALAKEGVWATDAHSASTVCTPSRYALLRGRYAWRSENPVYRLGPWDSPVIEAGSFTLPRMLKSEGYETALIGKWHLGFNWPWKGGTKPGEDVIGADTSIATADMFDWTQPLSGGPLDAGFDYYFGDDIPNMPPYAFIENQHITANPVVDVSKKDMQPIMPGGYFHGDGPGEAGWQIDQVMPRLTEKAVSYIGEKSTSQAPFFLIFSATSPHTPIVPTEQFRGKSGAGFYGDYMMQTDDTIGRLVKVLKDKGVFDNTLIILTSDNGPAPFMRDLIQKFGHNPSGSLRGVKRDHLEGGHRVPFVASWPDGDIKGGKKIDALISQTDIMATLAAVVGGDIPEGEGHDSLNILPSLRHDERVRTQMVYQGIRGGMALREGDWVYMPTGNASEEPEWYLEKFDLKPLNSSPSLYNLSGDLIQRENLIEAHPEVSEQMDRKLKAILEENSGSQHK